MQTCNSQCTVYSNIPTHLNFYTSFWMIYHTHPYI
jgi:hypothetical protein